MLKKDHEGQNVFGGLLELDFFFSLFFDSSCRAFAANVDSNCMCNVHPKSCKLTFVYSTFSFILPPLLPPGGGDLLHLMISHQNHLSLMKQQKKSKVRLRALL